MSRLTGCEVEVPLLFDKSPEAALLDPYPIRYDVVARPVTCLTCHVMGDS